MDVKQIAVIFMIVFIGVCGIIKVDRQCMEYTGTGGEVGLTLEQTQEGNIAFCFFGMEGEFGL